MRASSVSGYTFSKMLTIRPLTVRVAERLQVSPVFSASERSNCIVGKSPTICALIEKFPVRFGLIIAGV